MKKLLCTLLSMVMVVVATNTPMISHATDASSEVNYLKVADYRDAEGNRAPEAPTGTVFAGWYKDAACTKPWGETITEERAYAKFVNQQVLRAKYQLAAGTTVGSAETTLRLVTTVDSLNFQKVGFVLTMDGANSNPAMSDTVYSQLRGIVDGQEVFYNPDVFCQDSEYFMVYEVTGMPKSVYGKDIKVTPQWVTLDGTTVQGVATTFSVVKTLIQPDVLSVKFNADGSAVDTVSGSTFNKVGNPSVAYAYNDVLSTYAATFNGADAFGIDFSDGFNKMKNAFTVELYGKFNGAQNNTVMLGSYQGAGFALWYYNGGLYFDAQTSNGYNYIQTTGTGMVYQHIVATYDGSTLKFYVDGELLQSCAATGTVTPGTVTNLYLGADTGGGGPECWSKSTIVTANIYTNAFTGEEVQGVYDAYYKNGVQLLQPDVFSLKINEDGSAEDTARGGTLTRWGTTQEVAYNEKLSKYEVTLPDKVASYGKEKFNDSFTNSFTIELYGKYNDASGGYLIGNDNSYGGGFGIRSIGGRTRFEFTTSEGAYSVSTPTTLEYQYIVVTWNGSVLNLYVDGQLVDSTVATGTYVKTDGNDANKLVIGGCVNNFGFPTDRSKSTIATVNIYSCALTAAQVGTLYAAYRTDVIPTVFSNGMLFQQNKPMNVWGYSAAGETVTANLYQGDTLLEAKEAVTAETGRWEVAFDARKGSYDKYSIEIITDGQTIKSIEDILVGELWIAAGQSNMELQVSKDMDSETLLAGANNEYIRMYLEPTWPQGGGSPQPANPVKDIPKAFWGYGNNQSHVSQTSSVAYVFAKNLQEELGVPVGIVNCAVGGMDMEAWLSRDAIESDADVKAAMQSMNMYYTEEQYGSLSGGKMSTIYNQKIGPLAGMNIAGVIWYHGENNVTRSQVYDDQLDLLKRSWSEVFGFEDGDMPFIFTQVAPYKYSTIVVKPIAYLSMFMEQFWKQNADKNTAMITLYDLPLDHMKNNGSTQPIHPRVKTPLGERFFTAAWNMLYGGNDEYTAPVYKSMEIKDGAIYVTLDRVGNSGLTTTDGSLDVHGFTIAGSDGVYVNAQAQIVDKDTVKVWNNHISEPKNAMYAFDNFNQGANLCNSVMIPASPFRTLQVDDTGAKPDPSITYFTAQDWMYADKDVWVYDSTFTQDQCYGYRPSFSVVGGSYTYSSDVYKEGLASLKVAYNDDFSLSPILTYESIVQDWSKFNYLSVDMLNAENVEVALVITSGGVEYQIPTVAGANKAVISGSTSDFTSVTFDLSAVDASVLQNLTAVTFKVSATSSGEMYFDNFLFGR